MCLLTVEAFSPELDDTPVEEINIKPTMGSNVKGNNKERRREKSKLAARNRRGKETEVFDDLSELLPIPDPVRESLDKASIVRLACCTIKLDKLRNHWNGANNKSIGSEIEEAQNLCQALGGFLVVLSANGDILLTSENITTSLGLANYEVMGRSIYDFSHPCDHRDVKELLAVNKGQETIVQRSALIRLKCTLTAKGSCVHIRAATDKVIRFTGKTFDMGNDLGYCFIGVGETIATPTANNNTPFKNQTFQTTHSADFKCVCVDDSVTKWLGYNESDMLGKPLFDFQHGVDALNVSVHFKNLHSKGQIRTDPYRFLAKNGGWAWVITEASVLKASNSSDKSIKFVCRHILISEIQNQHELISVVQVPDPAASNRQTSDKAITGNTNKLPLPLILDEVASSSTPVLSTAKIFAPRTEDMDSGFLMPYDCSGTIKKDHDDIDLTHLAPIAGDECVPLNSELFDDFLSFINSSTLECPILDIDELDFLNSSDGTIYVPIEELDVPHFDNGRDSPVLTQNNDPLLGSTININFNATPAPGPISDHDSMLTGFDPSDQQQQLDSNFFDFGDMEFPGNLGGDLSQGILPELPQPLSQQNSSPLPQVPNASAVSSKFQTVSPARFSFLEIENCLLKRKAEGNAPKVVTKSVFSHISDSPVVNTFPPTKLLKLSNVSSQFTDGYDTEAGSNFLNIPKYAYMGQVGDG